MNPEDGTSDPYQAALIFSLAHQFLSASLRWLFALISVTFLADLPGTLNTCNKNEYINSLPCVKQLEVGNCYIAQGAQVSAQR